MFAVISIYKFKLSTGMLLESPVGSDIVKKNVELDGPGENSYPWDNHLDLN